MNKTNIFENLPEHLDQEVFNTLVENKNVTIERIVSNGHTSPNEGWYDQERDEWVIVLKGAGELTFEDSGSVKLEAGDYINIPAHTRHKVSWTSPDTETIWLAVHY
ncbi:cupin domain-containing protein [Alkalimarinus coralli]|uniref:cupin domain-containing protein n=1 Tax=Alkalimarinus coralli TaxID=2935863 RepID=UPI00202AFA8D|nr:cupin domain-containing protein [Alkalimarinus coralli]